MAIILSAEAKQDLINISNYTIDNWGVNQARAYINQLEDAYNTLMENPLTPISKSRNELRNNLRSLNVEKHTIYYQNKGGTAIEIIRILHQAMDFKQHF